MKRDIKEVFFGTDFSLAEKEKPSLVMRPFNIGHSKITGIICTDFLRIGFHMASCQIFENQHFLHFSSVFSHF